MKINQNVISVLDSIYAGMQDFMFANKKLRTGEEKSLVAIAKRYKKK